MRISNLSAKEKWLYDNRYAPYGPTPAPASGWPIYYTDEQIKDIQALATDAEDAATKVKTFTQLIDTLMEALGSGWTNTWEAIFGDFYEARDFWTGMSDALGELIGASAEARNALIGDAFDSTVTEDGERIGAGKLEIAGIQMVINPDSDAYEVEIPEAKAVYMHMLGHDCHSIVAGAGHADAIIANLKGYLDRGFQIFLSAHYGPETRQDVQTQIDYLEMLKEVASGCSSADEFKAAVNERCPEYSGANYLDMTAGFFFPGQ